MRICLWLGVWLAISLTSALTAQDQVSDPVVNQLLSSADLNIESGQLDSAQSELQEALLLDPTNYAAYLNLGRIALLRQDYTQAIADFTLAAEQPFTAPEAFLRLGDAYLAVENPKKALRALERGLKQFPNAPDLYAAHGRLAWDRGKQSLALDSWEAGIRVAPDYSPNYYYLSRACMEQGYLVWALLYGEIFRHLEPQTARSHEFAQQLKAKLEAALLGQTGFVPAGTGGASVGELLEGFSGAFDLHAKNTASMMFRADENLPLEKISLFRQAFIRTWYAGGNASAHPNPILAYWKQLNQTGHMDAYVYWLYTDPDAPMYQDWVASHAEQYQSFTQWLTTHPIQKPDAQPFLHSVQP